jgi:hypothetical protein
VRREVDCWSKERQYLKDLKDTSLVGDCFTKFQQQKICSRMHVKEKEFVNSMYDDNKRDKLTYESRGGS